VTEPVSHAATAVALAGKRQLFHAPARFFPASAGVVGEFPLAFVTHGNEVRI